MWSVKRQLLTGWRLIVDATPLMEKMMVRREPSKMKSVVRTLSWGVLKYHVTL